ncbi:D-alanyl-D-alanine carboxypeptidase family protein [Lachnospiraceae bacterium C1.1]|nr:D-alanyl-D-alanine carboxypeptidase family protein [Lachnospiraceae bacterium C1.1]
MKCISNFQMRGRLSGKRLFPLLISIAVLLTGCGSKHFDYAFDANNSQSAFRFDTSNENDIADSFASNLAVVSGDVIAGEEVSTGENSYGSAILVNSDSNEVLFSKNANAKLYPASMTKVMTALVALENCDKDKILTADANCLISEEGAQLAGLQVGDTMTLDQALHILLIYSANDVAVMIADNIGGSVEGFADMMNAKAAQLGATNTHFVNPHGLHDENHYTTAYDMYLMFNAACKYEEFTEIINMSTYTTSYKHANGNSIDFTCNSTNRFITGKIYAPTNITVMGGKTGTTLAAGACLVMLSKDTKGASYISCVMKGTNIDATYGKTKAMLEIIE